MQYATNNLELMRCIMAKHDPARVLTGSDYSEEAESVLQTVVKDKKMDLAEAIRSVFLTRYEKKLDTSLFPEQVADDWLTVNMRSW